MESHRRTTKYSAEILRILQEYGHASNTCIAATLRQLFPAVSDTTVHRVTGRLCQDGVIALAPAMKDGSVRYDATTVVHDHFMCTACDQVKDISLPMAVRDEICKSVQGCVVNGSFTISGSCCDCITNKEEL